MKPESEQKPFVLSQKCPLPNKLQLRPGVSVVMQMAIMRDVAAAMLSRARREGADLGMTDEEIADVYQDHTWHISGSCANPLLGAP